MTEELRQVYAVECSLICADLSSVDSARRNITAWRMTDEEGKVIEEKNFEIM